MSFGLHNFGTTNSSTGNSASQGRLEDLQNDAVVPQIGDDSVSDIAFSPTAEFMAVSSWDGKNRIYEIQGAPSGNSMGMMGNMATNTALNIQGRALYGHDGPILSTRFTQDGTKVVSGSADRTVKVFDLASQQNQSVGRHDDAVRVVRCVQCGPQNTPCIVSGSWDKTVKYWDMRQPNPICTLSMPERVYAMDSSQKLLVVATAGMNVEIIGLDSPDKIFRHTRSPLKEQTRSVGCFPKGDGYAIGSIEGRCGIQYIDESQKANTFSFKCQRVQKPAPKEVHIYSVNSIVFHPVYGTFATAGSDGTFSFWDKDSRHRLKVYPEMGATIPVVNFNRTGSLYAYALSYDWSKGFQYNTQGYTNTVRVHVCKDEEVKPRPAKRR